MISYRRTDCIEKAIDSLEQWITTTELNGDLNSGCDNFLEEILPFVIKLIQSSNVLPIDAEKGVHTIYSPELSPLCVRSIKILGRTASRIKNLPSMISNIDSEMAWDFLLRININLPFPQENVDVHLDRVLPRAIELSLFGSQRGLKVAACEFLHSMTIWMVAVSATDPNFLPESSKFCKFYPKIFKTLFQLAVDVDHICQQLFRNLIFQLIHWFCARSKFTKSKAAYDSKLLLDNIVDGISDPYSGAMRVFAVECMFEHFKWALKFNTADASKKHSDRDLLSSHFSCIPKLLGLCTHPNALKRLGACLSLNRIYRLFKAENSLIIAFGLDLLRASVSSLALATKDSKAISKSTISESRAAIHNYSRIVLDSDRIIFQDLQNNNIQRFGGIMCSSIDSFCVWILKESISQSMACRHECFFLLNKMLSLLKKTPMSFINEFARSEKNKFEIYFEDLLSLESGSLSLSKYTNSMAFGLHMCIWLGESSTFDQVQSLEFSRLVDKFCIHKKFCSFIEHRPLISQGGIEESSTSCQIVELSIKYFLILASKCLFYFEEESFLSQCLRFSLTLLFYPSLYGYSTTSPNSVINVQKQVTRLVCELYADSKLQLQIQSEFRIFFSGNDEINFWNSDKLSVISSATKTPILINAYFQLLDRNLWSLIPSSKHKVIAWVIDLIKGWEFNGLPLYKKNTTYLIRLFFALINDLPNSKDFLTECISNLSSHHEELIPLMRRELIRFSGVCSVKILEILPDLYFAFFSSPFRTIFLDLTQKFVLHSASDELFLKAKLIIASYLSSLKDYLTNQLNIVEMKRDLVTVLEFLPKSTKNILGSFPDKDVEFLWKTFSDIIDSTSYSVETKARVIRNSHLFLAANISQSVKTYVLRTFYLVLGRAPFGLNSEEVFSDSIKRESYCMLLDSFLDCLSASADFGILQLLLPVLRETNHKHRRSIREKIDNLTETLSDPIKAFSIGQPFISEVMLYILDRSKDSSPSNNAREWLVKNILISYLKNCPVACAEKLIKGFSSKLLTWIIEDGNAAGPLLLDSLEVQQIKFLEMKLAYEILNAFVLRLPVSILKSIFDIKEIGKVACFHVKNTNLVDTSDTSHRIMLEFHWSSYEFLGNALIKLVPPDKASKLLTVLAFKENRQKQEVLWNNIVDVKSQLRFRIDTDFSRASESKYSLRAQDSNSSGYLPLKYLENSSLSQDMPYMHSVFEEIRSESSKTDSFLEISHADVSYSDTLKKEKEFSVENLELDQVNSNKSMRILLKIIDHLGVNEVSNQDIPGWMKEIIMTLSNPLTAVNVKWFLIKIIIQRSSLFESQASIVFVPIVDVFLSDKDVGFGFHYFLRDICIVFLSWKSFVHDDNTARYASLFIEYLIGRSSDYGQAGKDDSEEKSRTSTSSSSQFPGKGRKLRHNIQIVQDLIQLWRERLKISKAPIIRLLLSHQDSSDGRVSIIVGLQLLGSILANGFPEIDLNIDGNVNPENYFEALFRCLKSTHKDIYESASEIIGMILEYHDSHSDLGSQSLLSNERITRLRDYFDTLYRSGEYPRYLNSLTKISMHFRSFVSAFEINRIFLIVQNLPGEIQCWALQILLWKANNIEEFMLHVRPLINSILSHKRTPSLRLMLLLLYAGIEKCIPSEVESDICHLYDSVAKHDDETSRISLYKILIWLVNAADNPYESRLFPMLFTALGDPSKAVRNLVIEFLDKGGILSDSAPLRLVDCVKKLYCPSSEEHWVQYSAFLLLELSKRSPNFLAPLSRRPIADCEFYDLEIDPSYISSNVETPLFVENPNRDSDYQLRGKILATQIQDYSLSQSIAELDEPSQILSFAVTDAAKSSFFQSTQSIDRIAEPHVNSQDVDSQLVRFDLNRSKTMVNQVITKHDQMKRYNKIVKDKVEEEQKNAVQIYRKYRVGELPDIEIPFKDIVMPLQASLNDFDIAKMFLLAVFDSLYEIMDEGEKNNLHSGLEHMLQATNKNQRFVSTILIICSKCKGFIVDVNIAGETALLSKSFHSGIILLENTSLEAASISYRSAKRKKTTDSLAYKDELKLETLIQLTLLYDQIGEIDIVNGLIEKFDFAETLKSAISATLEDKYENALMRYEDHIEALDTSDIVKNNSEMFQVRLYISSRFVTSFKVFFL